MAQPPKPLTSSLLVAFDTTGRYLCGRNGQYGGTDVKTGIDYTREVFLINKDILMNIILLK